MYDLAGKPSLGLGHAHSVLKKIGEAAKNKSLF